MCCQMHNIDGAILALLGDRLTGKVLDSAALRRGLIQKFFQLLLPPLVSALKPFLASLIPPTIALSRLGIK